MTGREFLTVARQLAGASTEAEWRSAISRAYYAAFHVAREFLEELQFVVPRADRAHVYSFPAGWQNCGHAQTRQAGTDPQRSSRRSQSGGLRSFTASVTVQLLRRCTFGWGTEQDRAAFLTLPGKSRCALRLPML